ncbi:DivIVA domain-containing protein [Actinoplanes sp. NPDC051470]|uniref:DivIVA domain-containing protein n=1 Tax=unclassified Actinoplanes TaxID=2626549 RepID=UPI003427FE15
MRSNVPLTPADIHNTVFGKSPLGKRGYHEEEVDALLDEVSEEMIALLELNEELRRRAGQTVEPSHPSPPSPRPDLAALNAELRRAAEARDRAEREAREVQARLDAARRAASAAPPSAPVTKNTDRVLAMAETTAQTHLREAEDESNALIASAREQADRTVTDARASVLRIESDARRQHGEAVAGTQGARTALLHEIDDLTRLAAGYHAALQNHLALQEKLLDGTPDADPS